MFIFVIKVTDYFCTKSYRKSNCKIVFGLNYDVLIFIRESTYSFKMAAVLTDAVLFVSASLHKCE